MINKNTQIQMFIPETEQHTNLEHLKGHYAKRL